MKNNKNTPIIVANTDWPLPKNLLNDVKGERMINALIDKIKPLKPEEQVGWAELVAYLMPAAQKAPLSSRTTKIYLYCCTQYSKRKKIEIPEEIKVKELTDYEKDQLRKLRLWIFEKRGGKEKNNVINAINEVFDDFSKKEKDID